MKYLISLLLGMTVGAGIFAAGLYFNPFIAQDSVSPLAVTDAQVADLSYSAVADDSILFTNDGESTVNPYPDRVSELWEPAIADTELFVTRLEKSRGETAGLGIKFLTRSEGTRLIDGEALVNSVWHIYLPDQGTLLIDQEENYWAYLRDVVVPAQLDSGDNWRGSFHRVMTVGPSSLGTARVTGGSGTFSGMSAEAVESLTARAYSTSTGLVAATGNVTMTLPADEEAQVAER